MFFEVKGLHKSFGGLTAVRDVNMSLKRNEVRALIGPNGAGKTTFFNLIAGNLVPDEGKVIFEGEDITRLKPYEVYRRGIHRTFQHLNLFPKFTVFQSVQLALLSANRKETSIFSMVNRMYHNEAVEIIQNVGLENKIGTISSALSHGDRRRLDIAIALVGRPKLLLLDEPASGLSTQEAEEVMKLSLELAKKLGLTIFFIDHDIAIVFSVAERISVLHEGMLIAEGSPSEVKSNTKVQEIYLGE